ncbi:MAG: transposase [Shimia sp.]
MRDRAALLRAAPGVGPVSALALMAKMPELGTLTPRQVWALAGLASLARESGLRSGKRRIGGGRKPAGRAVYGWAQCGPKRSVPARSLGQTRSKRQSTKAS